MRFSVRFRRPHRRHRIAAPHGFGPELASGDLAARRLIERAPGRCTRTIDRQRPPFAAAHSRTPKVRRCRASLGHRRCLGCEIVRTTDHRRASRPARWRRADSRRLRICGTAQCACSRPTSPTTSSAHACLDRADTKKSGSHRPARSTHCRHESPRPHRSAPPYARTRSRPRRGARRRRAPDRAPSRRVAADEAEDACQLALAARRPPFVKIGGAERYRRSDVEGWLRASTVPRF